MVIRCWMDCLGDLKHQENDLYIMTVILDWHDF